MGVCVQCVGHNLCTGELGAGVSFRGGGAHSGLSFLGPRGVFALLVAARPAGLHWVGPAVPVGVGARFLGRLKRKNHEGPVAWPLLDRQSMRALHLVPTLFPEPSVLT